MRALLLAVIAISLAAGCSSSSAPKSAPAPTTIANSPYARFCVAGKELGTKYVDGFSFSDKAKATAAAADFRRLANQAPSAIKADMQTMATTFDRVARSGIDGFKQDQDAFTQAEKNLAAWIRQHCALLAP